MSDSMKRAFERAWTDDDDRYMSMALAQAGLAAREGEVPVGAVLIEDGEVVAGARNGSIARSDPSAHAEILVLREAGRQVGNYRLPGMTLYVTVEPCAMCAGALVHARIARLVYGADDPKSGAVRSLYRIVEDERLNHSMEVCGGVRGDEAAALMQSFFRERREVGEKVTRKICRVG